MGHVIADINLPRWVNDGRLAKIYVMLSRATSMHKICLVSPIGPCERETKEKKYGRKRRKKEEKPCQCARCTLTKNGRPKALEEHVKHMHNLATTDLSRHPVSIFHPDFTPEIMEDACPPSPRQDPAPQVHGQPPLLPDRHATNAMGQQGRTTAANSADPAAHPSNAIADNRAHRNTGTTGSRSSDPVTSANAAAGRLPTPAVRTTSSAVASSAPSTALPPDAPSRTATTTSRRSAQPSRRSIYFRYMDIAAATAFARSTPNYAPKSRADGMPNLRELLRPLHLEPKECGGAGNCLFLSLQHQLQRTRLTGLPALDSSDASPLRRVIVDHLDNHRDDFAHYVNGNFTRYVANMRTAGAWGGEPELRAAADALRCNIVVHSTRRPHELQYNVPNPRATLRVGYVGGNHYVSVVPTSSQLRVWQCSCGHFNDGDAVMCAAPNCDACHTAMWTCPRCTLANPKTYEQCQACAAPQGGNHPAPATSRSASCAAPQAHHRSALSSAHRSVAPTGPGCTHYDFKSATGSTLLHARPWQHPPGNTAPIHEHRGPVQDLGHKVNVAHPNLRIGVMVAGNSGKPGGALGGPNGLKPDAVHLRHKTQEEDVLSTWMQAEADPDDATMQADLFRRTIFGRWGMLNPRGTDPATVQGVNYADCDQASQYADAWVVRNAVLSKRGNPSAPFVADLVFVGGPNRSAKGRDASSSTTRTLNKRCAADYPFFKSCVKAAVTAGIDAMIGEGVNVALIAPVSCGIYAWNDRDANDKAGRNFQQKLRREFKGLVEDILDAHAPGCTHPRSDYFHSIFIPQMM